MRLLTRVAINTGKTETLVKKQGMGKGASEYSKKTRLQNEDRFENQYNQSKGKCIQAKYNSESGLYEERQN